MEVKRVTYMNTQEGVVRVFLSGGGTVILTWPGKSTFHDKVQEWLSKGNKIEGYSEIKNNG